MITKLKNYVVTYKSTENVYGDSQLLKSVFESMFTITQGDIILFTVPATEESRKEIAIA